jgi:hypothetical protein
MTKASVLAYNYNHFAYRQSSLRTAASEYSEVVAVFVVMVKLSTAKTLEKGLVGAVFPHLRHLEELIAQSRSF